MTTTKRFEDLTLSEQDDLLTGCIDWAMNGYATDDYDSDAHQYIQYLIEEGELHEDDESDATEWLEDALERHCYLKPAG